MKSILVAIVAALLVVGCGPPPQPPDISLLESAEKGYTDAVKQHIAAGSFLDERDGRGRTPLHLAAKYGHKEIAKLLIAKGADVNAKNGDGGDTPLQDAAWYGHKEIVELLIENGADVNVKDSGLWTPLHDAAYQGHREVAELLIANGTDVNAKNENGHTPLDLVSKAEIATLLRKHGGKRGRR